MKTFKPKSRNSRTADPVGGSTLCARPGAVRGLGAMGPAPLQAMIHDSPVVRAEAERQALINNSPAVRAEAARHALIHNSPPQVAQRQRLAPPSSQPFQRREGMDEEQEGLEFEDAMQGRFAGPEPVIQSPANEGRAANRTGMPDHLKAGMEQLSGLDLSGLRVHYNSAEPAQLNALAHTQGQNIHVGPGQERHLPHEAWHAVQQMQGRVKPTLQAKGVAINDAAGLEHEADVMGAEAMRTQAAEQPAAGPAGQAVPAVQREVGRRNGSDLEDASMPIQRKMGMELEVGRRITSAAGDKLAGDTTLLDHQYFQVVSDSRTIREGSRTGTKYSNMEFVMKAFDQLGGSLDEARHALTVRLDAIRAFFDLAYTDDAEHDLSALAGVGTGAGDIYRPQPKDPANPGAGDWGDAKISPLIGGYLPRGHDRGDKKGKLFCHFTVGVPVTRIAPFMRYLAASPAGAAPNTYSGSARNRERESVEVADAVAANYGGGLAAPETEELRGAVALLYTQVAAFAIKVDGPGGRQQPGQIKNMTPVVSRVRLRHIYDSLTNPVKTVLRDNSNDIINVIADKLDGIADFGEDFERDVGAPHAAIQLIDYTNSGLGRHGAVDQERVFGGMMELPGMDTDHGMDLIPLEIRHFKKQLMDWNEVRQYAEELLAQSRHLVGIPDTPPAAAAPPPGGPGLGGPGLGGPGLGGPAPGGPAPGALPPIGPALAALAPAALLPGGPPPMGPAPGGPPPGGAPMGPGAAPNPLKRKRRT